MPRMARLGEPWQAAYTFPVPCHATLLKRRRRSSVHDYQWERSSLSPDARAGCARAAAAAGGLPAFLSVVRRLGGGRGRLVDPGLHRGAELPERLFPHDVASARGHLWFCGGGGCWLSSDSRAELDRAAGDQGHATGDSGASLDRWTPCLLPVRLDRLAARDDRGPRLPVRLLRDDRA